MLQLDLGCPATDLVSLSIFVLAPHPSYHVSLILIILIAILAIYASTIIMKKS